MSQSDDLSDQQVVDYLQRHPDFFNQHLELLENLMIPHPTNGNVVSLVTRQLDAFRHKQQILEDKLNSLVEVAKHNDLCASRMHILTLALLNSATLEAAISNLNQILTEIFLTDFVALKIIGEPKNSVLSDYFISDSDENLHHVTVELIHGTPRCGRMNIGQSQFLFGSLAAQIKSCAIIPIVRSDLTALLVIGSRDEDRFHYSLGSLFLIQLSEIISLRLATLVKNE